LDTSRIGGKPSLGINMVILVVGLKKQVAIFVEGPGDSQVDSAAASQDDF